MTRSFGWGEPPDAAARRRRNPDAEPSSYELELRARRAEERSYYDTTGVCGRRVLASDVIGQPCPVCQHNDALHPGFPNPTLLECVACRQQVTLDALNEVAEAWRREHAYRDVPNPPHREEP